MQSMPGASGYDRFEGVEPTAWPLLEFNWDTSPQAYRHTIDPPSGLLPKERAPHVYVLSLGWARLSAIDELLSPHSRQDHVQDFWERGCPSKFARLLAHLSEGKPVSPPLIKIVESGLLFLAGGHHRYAIARTVGIQEIPFYIETAIRERVAGMLAVRWADG